MGADAGPGGGWGKDHVRDDIVPEPGDEIPVQELHHPGPDQGREAETGSVQKLVHLPSAGTKGMVHYMTPPLPFVPALEGGGVTCEGNVMVLRGNKEEWSVVHKEGQEF